MANEAKPFELGLVMAGAVSAGAYTAGVIDFLMEALETWENKKGEQGVPTHQVKIKVITGASAGSITAAVFASSLRGTFSPSTPSALWQTWVAQVDIKGLLGITDFGKSPEVKSVLDSTFLDGIAGNVLSQNWNRQDWPKYLADPLQFYFTVTNLRGIPYSINFKGEGVGESFGMSSHADYMHFSMNPSGVTPSNTHAIPLGGTGHRDGLQGNWEILKDSALASGAFPIGLAARVLKRVGTAEYDDRLWPIRQEGVPVNGSCECTQLQTIEPAWPEPWQYPVDRADWEYKFVNVDGGVANNEPFELARRCLAGDASSNPRDAKTADKAVLMIDPFPNESAIDFNYASETGIVSVIKNLLGAMVAQLRFKTEELELAKRKDVYSRWIIAPVRRVNEVQVQYPLASGGLLAFAGFMHRSFREHDYQLGRRNCQKFLRDTLKLHKDNPIFAESSAGADDRPIIPLYGNCDVEVVQPIWPSMPNNPVTQAYFDDLRKKLHERAAKLYFSWVDTKVSGRVDRGLLKVGWYIFGTKKAAEGVLGSLVSRIKRESQGWNIRFNDVVDPIIDIIKKDFVDRNLL